MKRCSESEAKAHPFTVGDKVTESLFSCWVTDQRYRPHNEAKQLSRAASSLLFTRLDFTTKPNVKYPSEDIQKVFARSAFDGKFIHTTAKELQLARGVDVDRQGRSPLAKPLLYYLGNLSPNATDEYGGEFFHPLLTADDAIAVA